MIGKKILIGLICLLLIGGATSCGGQKDEEGVSAPETIVTETPATETPAPSEKTASAPKTKIVELTVGEYIELVRNDDWAEFQRLSKEETLLITGVFYTMGFTKEIQGKKMAYCTVWLYDGAPGELPRWVPDYKQIAASSGDRLLVEKFYSVRQNPERELFLPGQSMTIVAKIDEKILSKKGDMWNYGLILLEINQK